MREWYSGLLRYRWLLPIQVAITVFMVQVCLDYTHRSGSFFVTDPRKSNGLIGFAVIYAGGMAVRFVVQRIRHRDRGVFALKVASTRRGRHGRKVGTFQ